jgi:GT2 family glycosyltransferase
VALDRGRLVVEGRAAVARVTLDLAGRQDAASPDAQGRFRLALPEAPEPAILTLGTDRLTLPPAPPLRRALGQALLLPGFALALAGAAPAGLRWLRRRDPADRRRVKRRLGLDEPAPLPLLDPGWLPDTVQDPTPEPPPEPPPAVTLILPVHNALALLRLALDRVAAHTDLPWHLIAIEDGSTDPAVRPFLRLWAADLAAGRIPTLAPGRVTLIEPERNLGFIGAVNLGFARALEEGEGPILLLNSDALVPAGWAGRLVAPLAADPSIASVTPMSNDAELMSVPAACARIDLAPGQGDSIDALARNLPRGEGFARSGGIVLPTGTGFCMAIARPWLERFPAFDPTFGRGYGEEVDWCQKTAAAGGRHLGLPGLFVEHRGGASFGTAEKQAALARNGAVISARWPRFDSDVQATLAGDPMATARLALGLAWASARPPVEDPDVPAGRVGVWIGHSMGGGADHDLMRRVARATAAGQGAVVLRLGGERRWQVELHSPSGITGVATDDTAAMLRLVRLLPRRQVIYSCAAGDPDLPALPGILCDLGEGEGQGITVLFHDHLPLSPSYTLLGADGMWHGLPPGDSRDPAHLWRPPGGGPALPLTDWRAAWGRLLHRAERIVTFSGATRDLVAAVWPELQPRIAVIPHAATFPAGKIPPGQGAGGRPVIGVLGNIGLHKGARVVAELGRIWAADGAARVVVIGNVDPAVRLPRGVTVQGDYRLDDLPRLVARHGIGLWLIPSIWPETFSFTTHEALATGLPVVAFDLGAQGAAVSRAEAGGAPGAVVPLSGDARAAAAALAPVLLAVARGA